MLCDYIVREDIPCMAPNKRLSSHHMEPQLQWRNPLTDKSLFPQV